MYLREYGLFAIARGLAHLFTLYNILVGNEYPNISVCIYVWLINFINTPLLWHFQLWLSSPWRGSSTSYAYNFCVQ